MATESTGSKLQALAERLVKETARGDITWSVVDEPTTFFFSIPTASVAIASIDKDGRPPYRFSLLDDKGIEVESLEPRYEWDEEYGANTPSARPWDEVLADLYDLARRSALNIDKILDDFDSALGPEV